MKPVLVLGAGINGCAVARDLAINGVPVVLVDRNDIAYGATSRSSRLIHGGLRYLEYRDIDLVRESLRERERLLRLAPQFVRPIRLVIPIRTRFGGLLASAMNFLRLGNTKLGRWVRRRRRARGLLAVRLGLSLYDWLAGASTLPRRSFQKVMSSAGDPRAADEEHDRRAGFSRTIRWVCGYSDAQIVSPERLCLSMLRDASASGRLDIHTYHECQFSDAGLRIFPANEFVQADHRTTDLTIEPSLIVNATGAGGDLTLRDLGIEHPQQFAGTKGTHLFTTHSRLREAIAGHGIYAEANDGRLVFILPLQSGVLIGTTDEEFTGRPEEAESTQAEVEYLLDLVNDVFPSVDLRPEDIEMSHAGVRPLPRVPAGTAADIPRGHALTRTEHKGIPIVTLIGGKLTTCRSFAEEVGNFVLREVGVKRTESTEQRPFPGAEGFLEFDPAVVADRADRLGVTPSSIRFVLAQTGNLLDEVFVGRNADNLSGTCRATGDETDDLSTECHKHSLEKDHGEVVAGTDIPICFVRWSLENEWVKRFSDLVERRLGLVFVPQVSRTTLRTLAELFLDARIDRESDPHIVEQLVDQQQERFQRFYRKSVLPD